MKIRSVALSLPSWELSNEELVDIIRHESKPIFFGDLEKTLTKIMILLKKSGSDKRFWLNRKINEKPIDHIIKVADQSLVAANMKKSDIDILVYCGIGKGFLEPGNAHLVARALGMNGARCFDVTDACMSWFTSMEIIDSMFKVGRYKTAMIINGEFNVQAGTFFKNFALSREEQIGYNFPAFTMGEGAAATILTSDNSDNFRFFTSSANDLADLCVVTLPEYKDYCLMSDKIGKNGEMTFTSFGFDLHELGTGKITDVFQAASAKVEEIDVVFTHASSLTSWSQYGERVGVAEKIYHIYQTTGNLVSASVPGAMSLALKENKLKRGDKVLVWVGSAGMSFSVCSFEF